MRGPAVLCLSLLLLLASVPHVYASQAPGHVFIALQAMGSFPEPLKKLVQANLGAYLAGSAGPDIAYTTYYVQIAMGWHPAGTEGHEVKTGELCVNFLNMAQTDQQKAFALGWLTHWEVDNIVHPLVNKYGGYYVTDDVRHKLLEQVECEHVFAKYVGDANLDMYIVQQAVVPAEFVNTVHAHTYRGGANIAKYLPGKDPDTGQPTPPAFIADFRGSAGNMQALTVGFYRTHASGSPGLFSSLQVAAVSGPPPTKAEYEQLMEPLKIDQVEFESPAAGEKIGYLKVSYTVNDVRLYKLFCDEWDGVAETAAKNIAAYVHKWSGNPAAFKLQNTDLNEGYKKFDANDPAQAWPGFPQIQELLVKVEMFNADGDQVHALKPDQSGPWDPTGEWVPCAPVWQPPEQEGQPTEPAQPDQPPEAPPEIPPPWKGLTEATARTQVWRAPAGSAYIKIPYDTTQTPTRVRVTLALAEKPTKKPYGIEATWNNEKKPELSILFLVDCSGSMGGEKLAAAKASVLEAVKRTNDGRTEWALSRFGGCTVSTLCRFTMNPDFIEQAVGKLAASGDTPLTYARNLVLAYLVTKGHAPRGRLIILCDGQDNCTEHGSASGEEAAGALSSLLRQRLDVTTGAGGAAGGTQ